MIEVGCLSFTQMLQEYLRAYPSLSHANAYLQIQQMAQWLDYICINTQLNTLIA